MEKKIVIKEVESPNLRVDVDGVRYELLCEYQAMNGVFHKVFIEESTNDVMIEVGKHSAIVGLFSAAGDRVRKLFDYMEASIDKNDGMVCWQEGEMQRHLERAMALGGNYPLLRKGVGLAEKMPLFYRQKVMDSGAMNEIARHSAGVEHVVEPEDYWEHEVSGLLEMDDWRSGAAQLTIEESLRDDLNSGYGCEVEEEFSEEPKVTQAGMLPEGWKWVDYPDGSGHLASPDGKEYFIYDVASGNYVEYKHDKDSGWSAFPGHFEDFKGNAERAILEFVLENDGSLKDMDKIRFYVIEDKRNNFSIEYFDDLGAAHERFMEARVDVKKFPALGVMVGDGSLDLLHGVNGDAVLVPDYRRSTWNWSEPMKAKIGDIEEAARWLVLEGGGVLYEYQNDILPIWLQGEMRVLVPVTLGDELNNSYCDGKVLKAEFSSGIDAIDSMYIEMHGWVGYNELLKHPQEYVADGVIKVPQMNVVYVQEKNVVGIDGRMDVAPCDFKAMVADISKPYALVVYDGARYTEQYRDKHDFIVGSFDDVGSAVKGWYELQERKRVPALVQDMSTTRREVLFNGFDEDNVRVSYEEAAKKFGFDAQPGLDDVLEGAKAKAGEMKNNGQERDMEM